MNCVEFERVMLEGEHTPEQQAHLSSCSACANLTADLEFISSQAKTLLASEEPSPAVWNALEAQLRREGLIRGPQPERPAFDFFRRWRMAWLVPVAAALAIVIGVRLHQPTGAGENIASTAQPASQQVQPSPRAPAFSGDDQQLLNTVAERPTAQRARYSADLDQANAFIRDAEAEFKSDPNDAYRQQMLMNAYEQKQMLYDLAIDRIGEQ